MGHTSSRSLEEVRAEYEALEDKRSSQGRALREEIKALEAVETVKREQAQAGSYTHPSPTELNVDIEEFGILPSLEVASIREKKAVYWCGVIPGDRNSKDGAGWPPVHQIDGIGGGVTFMEFWTPPEGQGQDGSARRGEYQGQLVELTESQVADIRRCLRTSVVRWKVREGRHRYGHILRIPQREEVEDLRRRFHLQPHEVQRLVTRAEQFRTYATDEPVARYIYCVKVTGPDAVAGAKWRPSTKLPPSVEKVGSIESP